MRGLFERSIEQQEPIQIIYMAGDGSLTQRYVTVRAINETHIVCYCHFRRQRRTFKIDNILSAGYIKKKMA